MGRGTSLLAGRGFLLLPAVALVVHELRYLIAYGGQADAALAKQGHGYVDSLAPWLVLLLALSLGSFLRRVARSAAGRCQPGQRRAFVRLWVFTSLSLYGLFVVQETFEGLFASGHPGGWAAIFGHGGWWALAAAVLLGAGVAGLLRLAEAVVSSVAPRRVRFTTARGVPARSSPESTRLVRRRALAGSAAGRAPPQLDLST